jgi:hypothetical protein
MLEGAFVVTFEGDVLVNFKGKDAAEGEGDQKPNFQTLLTTFVS